jgi:hypothetical protein
MAIRNAGFIPFSGKRLILIDFHAKREDSAPRDGSFRIATYTVLISFSKGWDFDSF